MRSFHRIRLLIVGAIVLAAAVAMAATPKVVTYQGRITDAAGNPVADGPYTVDFRLYPNPAGGILLWSEPGILVTTEKGLFTTSLGSPTPFPSGVTGPDPYGPDFIFRNTPELWLEIEVNGTILAPRTKLQSVPYAMVSNGVSGASSAYPGVGVELNPEFATLRTIGFLGEEKVRLWGPSWGELQLYDAGVFSALTSEMTAYLAATANSGGTLRLSDNLGSTTLELNGGTPGDNSATLPTDAVNAGEILNEPGIAIGRYSGGGVLLTNTEATSKDFTSITITIPAPGYVVLDGMFYARQSGVNGVFAWVQITKTSLAPFISFFESQWTNSSAYSNAAGAYVYTNTPVKTAFFESAAGSYTYYLQGNAYSSNDPSASIAMLSPTKLQATYFPTSYGSVASISPVPPGDNPDFEVVTVTDPMTNQTTTSYSVDLRYYELQAKKAEAEALKAQLALQKARAVAGKSAGTSSQIIDQK